jgi:hypothetical protein
MNHGQVNEAPNIAGAVTLLANVGIKAEIPQTSARFAPRFLRLAGYRYPTSCATNFCRWLRRRLVAKGSTARLAQLLTATVLLNALVTTANLETMTSSRTDGARLSDAMSKILVGTASWTDKSLIASGRF